MSVTPQSFRSTFGEFADPQAYTDAAITIWINNAVALLDECRWGTMLDYGTMLYVAHVLVVRRRSALASAVGGVPGEVKGPLTSRTVDKVSTSFDSQAVTFDAAGFYNSTTYGLELWQLMLQFGAGPLQVTQPWGDPSNTDGGGFWFGMLPGQ
jgi:hypothetical protein